MTTKKAARAAAKPSGARSPARETPAPHIHIDIPVPPVKAKVEADPITARCVRSLREMADQLEASFVRDPKPDGITGLMDFQERFLAGDDGTMSRVVNLSLTYVGNIKFRE